MLSMLRIAAKKIVLSYARGVLARPFVYVDMHLSDLQIVFRAKVGIGT